MGSKLDKEAIDKKYNGIDEVDKFEIFVKRMQDDTETFEVHKNLLIKYLIARYKERIEITQGIDPIMSYKGKRLKPSKTLGYYNIKPGETIYALFRLAGC